MTTEDGTLEVHESGKGLTVEPGIYPATVKTVDDDEGKFGPQWRFTLDLDEYPGEEAWAWASANLGTKAKLHGWAGILLGRPLAIGEKIGRSELVGKRCQVVIKEREDGDGGTSRYVDDIMKAKGVLPRPLESAPPPTPAPASLKVDVVNEPQEACFCGAPVAAYSPSGEPLCAAHNAETLIEDEPEEPPVESEEPPKPTIIAVKEMKSRFDFQREAHQHFKVATLPDALHKAGFKSTMEVKDWPSAWSLLCQKMKEPA